jgi:hypothetical protein
VTTRILLRSPRSPFDPVRPFRLLERNLIGNNVGNLIFQDAAYRLLGAPGVELSVDGLRLEPRDAGEINERYDAYVVPFANAFRPQFARSLDRWTELIRELRIPVVVLGIGAQANAAYDLALLKPLEERARQFVAAVLDHAPSIGVRGAFTAEWLRSLGFRDVEVIGCPSMFWDGGTIRVAKAAPELERNAPISLTVSPYRREMEAIAKLHLARYPNITYVAQDDLTYELLLLPGSGRGRTLAGSLTDPAHPIFAAGRTRLFPHPRPWLAFLATQHITFGTRIHGAIAAILAGTPGFVFAHDSRTRELAEHFEIPHRLLADIAPETDAAQLYADADYSRLMDRHPARWSTFEAFLARHGLTHVFAAGGDRGAGFDRRYAEVDAPVLLSGGGGAMRGGKRYVFGARLAARRAFRRAIWTARAGRRPDAGTGQG